MARTPTIYRWDDAGSPDLDGLMPSTADKQRLWMHTILKSCLVDGYGDKAAAGWTMPHEEIVSNGCRFVLENAANTASLLYESGVFCGGSANVACNALWICSAVPSMDTPVGAWSYLLDYESRNSSSRHAHKINSNDAWNWKKWCVIANENTAIILAYTSDNNFSTSNTSGISDSLFLSFGVANSGAVSTVQNPVAGNFFIYGGDDDDYTRLISSWTLGAVVTSSVGITGIAREGVHGYLMRALNQIKSEVVDVFQVRPVEFMHSGESSPISNDTYTQHHLFTACALRIMDVVFNNAATMNAWMTARGFEYGVPFQMGNSKYVLFKSERDLCLLFCLDAAEWGGV